MYYKWAKRISIKDFVTTLIDSYKRIAIKTSSCDWIGSDEPAIILFSVHSAFHEGPKGMVNVKAILSAIKQNMHGPITLLLSEKAHLNVLAIEHGDYAKALALATHDAHAIAHTFAAEFEGCLVTYWDDFITKDSYYSTAQKKIMALYETDQQFQQLLEEDAQKTYTIERSLQFANKELYLDATTKDLLEQCIYALVAAKKGYRFEFYPGRQYECMQYVNATLLAPEERINHVHVYIAFEKK